MHSEVAALPWNGGRLGVESVAALPWNRWQACYGISGRFGVEYAIRLRSLVCFPRADNFFLQRCKPLFRYSQFLATGQEHIALLGCLHLQGIKLTVEAPECVA